MALVLSTQNVFEYPISLGLCTPEAKATSKIEIKPAKNFNLLLTLPEGRQLLIKQESRDRYGKTAGNFLKEWQIQTLLQKFPEFSHLRSCLSEAIYFDAENAILIFNYLSDYCNLADFYVRENSFPTEISTAIGVAIASIHRLTIDRWDYQELFPSTRLINPELEQVLGLLTRLTPEIFGSYPSDALKFFGLYQRYDSLGVAIAQLVDGISPCCLTHNDLKLNNILLAECWQEMVASRSPNGMVRLIDWEQSAWGDPAYDLGTLISSYLQAWLLSLMSGKTINLEETLRLAQTPLELVQPAIADLTRAYFQNFPEILDIRPDFLRRVVQFSGLSLIVSILATLQHEKTFGNQGICMLQVAKSLLCRPEQSIPTVFGMTAVELTRRSVLRAIK